MRLPPDALIEWRCHRCGALAGYVRSIDGRLALSWSSDGPEDRFNRPPTSRRGSRDFLIVTAELISEIEARGWFAVNCGRHEVGVPPEGFVPRPPRRRKVLTIPMR